MYNFHEATQRWAGRCEELDLAMDTVLNEAERSQSKDAHKAFMRVHGLLKSRKQVAEKMVVKMTRRAAA